MALNKVMLIGNVGKDPEITTKNDKKIARLSIATSEKYTDRNGEPQEKTEWHNVAAFGNTAEVIDKYVRKGDKLFIEGRLRTNEWTDQNGDKRRSTEINADRVELLGSLRDNASSADNDGRRNNARGASRHDDNEF